MSVPVCVAVGVLLLALGGVIIRIVWLLVEMVRIVRWERNQRKQEAKNQERLDLIDFWFQCGRRQGLQEENDRHQHELFKLMVDGADMIVDAQSGKKKCGRPRKKK